MPVISPNIKNIPPPPNKTSCTLFSVHVSFIPIDFYLHHESHNYYHRWGPGGSMSYVVGIPNNSYKPITNTASVRARLCTLQRGCTRLAGDKVYQLLAGHGRWFSPGTPTSSTATTGRHDIAEILLKVALKHQKSNLFYF